MRKRSHWIATLAVALVVSLLMASCGGASNSARSGGSMVGVKERDFKISMPRHLTAGTHVFSVHNEGPDDHELIAIRTGNGRLPLRRDAITLNEETLKPKIVGALEPGAPGASRKVTFRLKPGRYVFVCNMAGHFLGGMHMTVQVG
jgi:plastocyanin